MNTKATLFIVDDHQLVIDGILSMLHDDPEWEVIGYANTGEEAIKKIPLLRPDVVLMDLEMPGMNGFQATQKLLALVNDIKIVILTLHHEKVIAQKLIKLGACGYMLKSGSRQEFLHGLNAVRQGIKYYSPQLTEAALEINSLEIKKETNVKLLALLSEREREVLQFVAEGASSKEMATRLNLSAATVETHRKSLLKKLNARNSAELIRLAITEGLIENR
jgi:DNA-binding NarL/FixJ family response regulator